MVVLIVRRCYMPSLVQRSLIVLVRREVSGTSHSALSISNLDHRNQIVNLFIIVRKITEITKCCSRMIKLCDGIRICLQCSIIILQGSTISRVIRLCSALESICVKCIHMAKSIGPCHFIPEYGDKVLCRILICKCMSLRPFTAD